MIKTTALIRLWLQTLFEFWGYIWGASGYLWTEAKQAGTTNAMAKKWIGHFVIDCSGLAYWAFKKLGGKMYHGSNTIWNEYVTDKSELVNGKRADGKPMLPGDPVFTKSDDNGVIKRGHIGYYLGTYKGKPLVIEAQGTINGVCVNIAGLFSDRFNDGKGKPLTKWAETAHWKNVEYDASDTFVETVMQELQNKDGESTVNTLKNGSRGEAVRALQESLNKLGFNCGNADGIFGPKTEAGVRAFQAAKGLDADGIAGEATLVAVAIATSTIEPAPDQSENPGDNSPIEAPPIVSDTVAPTLNRGIAEALYMALKTALGV